MKPRIVGALSLPTTMLTTLVTVLGAAGADSPPEQGLPWCRGTGLAPTGPPTSAPSLTSPNACQARATQLQPVLGRPVPSPGYHHLGATSQGRWSGVLGRMGVQNPGVRAGSYDFVAARLMAKADTAKGVAWLEAGWTETGWTGGGRQRIYTYDTSLGAWAFYDQYRIKKGDQVWIFLQTEQDAPDPTWQAWLWWGDGWQLLAGRRLPLTGRAQIEQYVEVHTDPVHAASQRDGGSLPPVIIDNVQLKHSPTGPLRYWREDVPTAPGSDSGSGYCLDWLTHYDTWRAGDCRPEPPPPD